MVSLWKNDEFSEYFKVFLSREVLIFQTSVMPVNVLRMNFHPKALHPWRNVVG